MPEFKEIKDDELFVIEDDYDAPCVRTSDGYINIRGKQKFVTETIKGSVEILPPSKIANHFGISTVELSDWIKAASRMESPF